MTRPELSSSVGNNDITVQDLLVIAQNPSKLSAEPATAKIRSRWNPLRKAPKPNADSVPSDRQNKQKVPLFRRLFHIRKFKADTTVAPPSKPLARKLQQLLSKVHSKIFRKRSFKSKYTVVRKLGAGGNGAVCLAKRNSDDKLFVCKFIEEETVWHWKRDETSATGRIPLEAYVMRHLRDHGKNEGVTQFEEIFSMDSTLIIVMEYPGRVWWDLKEFSEQRGILDEYTAAHIFGQVVQNVAFVQHMGWYHNDIKDTNILINFTTLDVKLIDFGSASPVDPHRTVSTFYGTEMYASPEVIDGKPYQPEAQEVWALGVLLFSVLFKVEPFDDDEAIVKTPILRCIAHQQRHRQHKNRFVEYSTDVVCLLEGMLEKDWNKRWTLEQVMNSAWLKSHCDQ